MQSIAGKPIIRNTVPQGDYEDLGVKIGNFPSYRWIRPGQKIGNRIGAIYEVEEKIQHLRVAYSVAKTDKLKNEVRERAERLKERLRFVREQFVVDISDFGNYDLTRAEFLERWYGHNLVGLTNQTVLTVMLGKMADYPEICYVQYG